VGLESFLRPPIPLKPTAAEVLDAYERGLKFARYGKLELVRDWRRPHSSEPESVGRGVFRDVSFFPGLAGYLVVRSDGRALMRVEIAEEFANDRFLERLHAWLDHVDPPALRAI
jgi:hypothetical protein